MIFLLIFLLFAYFIWSLFSDGLIWRLIMYAFGWYGLSIFLENSFEFMKEPCFTFLNARFSWAETIPTMLVFFIYKSSKD